MPTLEVLEVLETVPASSNSSVIPCTQPSMETEDSDAPLSMDAGDQVQTPALECTAKSQAMDSKLTSKTLSSPVPATQAKDAAAEPETKAAESTDEETRKVTPNMEETQTQRQQQQKKISQMRLNSFFHKPNTSEKPAAKASSRSSPATKQKSTESLAKLNETASKESGNAQVTVSAATSKVDAVPAVASPPATLPESKPESSADTSKENSSSNDSATEKMEIQVEKSDSKAKPAPNSNSQPPAASKQEETTTEVAPPAPEKADTQPPPEPLVELSEERKALLKKHEDMRKRCKQRTQELVRGVRNGIEEENFSMPALQSNHETSAEEEFPEVVVANMVLLIEGSPLPLSKLITMVCEKLKERHSREWSEEAISNKIKLLSERKPFLYNIAKYKQNMPKIYEEETQCRLMRWEVCLMEILPSDILPQVRKARTARKKLLNHYMANQRLMDSLDAADKKIQDPKTKRLDMALAKVGKEEEKVLKFEREAEKQRLALQAKRKKELELEAKRREKELLAEQKRKEKERKKEEAERRKQEKVKEKQNAVEAREAEKRKKAEDKKLQEEQKKQKEEMKRDNLNKQKATFMSFFATSQKAKQRPSDDEQSKVPASDKMDVDSQCNDFDSTNFRSLFNSGVPHGPMFPNLSKSAKQSRVRRTRRIPVSVLLAVAPEENNFFDAQPFSELKTIHIPNKYRFLSFHEDCRPAYHGTWSKKSTIVTGRRPFQKDATHLDYDYDSEAEWEEGDDEIGEDIEDDANNQEEDEDDGNAKVYDYDDGFCVADDRYLDIDEDVDEETKALYKKKLQKNGDEIQANRICIVAPRMGGLPGDADKSASTIEGFEAQEVSDLFASHAGEQISKDLLWLDAFAPDNIDELEVPTTTPSAPKAAATNSGNGSSSNKDEYTVEEMRLLATFAHHCLLNSKEKLVEELRNKHVDVFSSRAKATRKLDSIAKKKKHPAGTGVYWEVASKVLTQLELYDVLAKKLEGCEPAQTTKVAKPPAKAGQKRKTTTDTDKVATKKQKAVKEPTVSKVASTATTKGSPNKKSPSKGSPNKSPKKAASEMGGSANIMMNFLQPRKKPKTSPKPVASPSN